MSLESCQVVVLVGKSMCLAAELVVAVASCQTHACALDINASERPEDADRIIIFVTVPVRLQGAKHGAIFAIMVILMRTMSVAVQSLMG